MKIVIIHPKGILETARKMGRAITNITNHTVEVRNPWKEDYRGDDSVDLVISLGCSAKYKTKRRLNARDNILKCTNKIETFKKLNECGVPTLTWTTSTEDASKWPCVCVRDVLDGKQGEGLDWWYNDSVEPLRAAPLYTKYFPHRNEYRVVYALGRCFVFNKKYNDENETI